MDNKISLIIPTYNSMDYIKRTIFSIMEQSNCEIEIIVVDSGSKDGTIEFCKKYVDKILYCPPGNMYSAINMGIRDSSHDLVAYINSDDYFYENVLADYINFFNRSNLDFAYSQGDFIDNNGRFRSSGYTPKINDLKPYFKIGLMPIIQPTIIYKKQLFVKLNGFSDLKYRFCADFDFCLRVLESDANIGFYDVRTVCFRVSNKQITNNHAGKMHEELKDILSSTTSLPLLKRQMYHLKYKYKNIGNIFMRSFRGLQMTGKLSLTRVIAPYK